MESADLVRKSLEKSNFHFFIKESPHSMWITIRKRFRNNKNTSCENILVNAGEALKTHIDHEKTKADYTDLQDRYDELKDKFEALRKDFENEICEHEIAIKVRDKIESDNSRKNAIIEKLKQEKDEIKAELDSTVSESRKISKLLRAKDKEIHDVSKDNEKVKDDFAKVSADLKDIRSKVNKEQKVQNRKAKSKDKKDFLNNLKSESISSEVPCDQCDDKFVTIWQLKLHVRNVHSKDDTTQTEEKVMESKRVQTFSIDFTSQRGSQTSEEKDFVMADSNNRTTIPEGPTLYNPQFNFSTLPIGFPSSSLHSWYPPLP